MGSLTLIFLLVSFLTVYIIFVNQDDDLRAVICIPMANEGTACVSFEEFKMISKDLTTHLISLAQEEKSVSLEDLVDWQMDKGSITVVNDLFIKIIRTLVQRHVLLLKGEQDGNPVVAVYPNYALEE